MDQGLLVPDEVVIGIVEERLRQPDAARGFILDGFPRTAAQAVALDAMLARAGTPLDGVLEIAAPVEQVVARLTTRLERSEERRVGKESTSQMSPDWNRVT